MNEIKITINDNEITAFKGQTILEVARANGIEIPTLCHDERVKVYGACGICVVEVPGAKGLPRACATEITSGMVIYTDSERIRASRKVTLELLLSDHTGDCRPPCMKACPAETDCQGYVGLIANGQHQEAVALIKEKLPLPASLGRVCPHPCETACRRELVEEPISIAFLKSFAGDFDLASGHPYMPDVKPATGKKVAIIGAGPAGLTAAYFLVREGHAVDVYDAMPKAGGMLRYGIPQYRLPKEILDQEIDLIGRLGVNFFMNKRVGSDITLDELIKNHASVFVGIGAWTASKLGCKGDDLPGVLGGIDFLRDVALNGNAAIGDRVAVVGGGNTAMDAARTAVRLGAKQVMVLYRRTRDEMPAEKIEIQEAMEEGVDFRFLVAPLEVLADNGTINAIRVQRMELGEPDASGRRSPVPIPGAEEVIELDTIISAIGQKVDPAGFGAMNLSKWKTLDADDDTLVTNMPGVFAGGDAVTGPGIAIEAVAQGKRAAEMMIRYLKGEEIMYREPYYVKRTDLTSEEFVDVVRSERIHMLHQASEVRRSNFSEVNLGFAETAAVSEANRCLECGCRDYFECRLIEYANQYEVKPERLTGAKHNEAFKEKHPFIERDSNKCILCGLCIRICDEVMGVTALGLVNRGFDSIVKPEFDLPLIETDCISCGQCASACPTGALVERQSIAKNVPLALHETVTACSFCGMTCEQVAETRGSMVVRTTPGKGKMLCRKGRFGFEAFNGPRLSVPMVRADGQLVESGLDSGIKIAAEKLQDIQAKYGPESLAVFVSPSWTMEEAEVAAYLTANVLGTPNAASFPRNPGRGLVELFGASGSTGKWTDLEAADLILMMGSLNESEMAAIRIRKAVKKGAGLVIISPESTLVDDVASIKVSGDSTSEIMQQIMAVMIDRELVNASFIEERTLGLAELKQSLAGIAPSPKAVEIAELYSRAANVMIVVDGNLVSRAGIQLAGDLALLGGRVGKPANGILVVAAGANSAGLWELGIRKCPMQIRDLIREGTIKGAIILGEDPVGAGQIEAGELAGLETLIVSAPFMNATAELAEVVLPASNAMETSGTFLSSDYRVRPVNKAVESTSNVNNTQIINSLMGALGRTPIDVDPGKYAKLDYQTARYQESFAMSDGKARFIMPTDNTVFRPASVSDPALVVFSTKLVQAGLK